MKPLMIAALFSLLAAPLLVTPAAANVGPVMLPDMNFPAPDGTTRDCATPLARCN